MGNSASFKFIVITLLSSAMFLLSQVNKVSAEIYKWTDEQGRIHYGDRPGNENSEQINIRQTGTLNKSDLERIQRRQRLLEVMDEERQEHKQNEEEQRLIREKRQANCEQAKKDLEGALTASYIYKQTSDPLNPKILSDEERNAATIEAQRVVNEWCS